jgi:hypothetical protein
MVSGPGELILQSDIAEVTYYVTISALSPASPLPTCECQTHSLGTA